jgi:threonine/homoserine/homoserine lactone efflux protein
MLQTQNLPTFIASGILLNISPGQDTVYIVSRSIAQGRRAGLLSVFGICTGVIFHILIATFGLASLIKAWPIALTVIKHFGAGYLAYLGVSTLRSKSSIFHIDSNEINSASDLKIWRDGLLTNITNPKIALFFLAFLPQFVLPENASGILPFLFLGAIFVFNGTIWCILLAIFSSEAFRFLRQDVKISNILNKSCGVIFIALALNIVLFST